MVLKQFSKFQLLKFSLHISSETLYEVWAMIEVRQYSLYVEMIVLEKYCELVGGALDLIALFQH